MLLIKFAFAILYFPSNQQEEMLQMIWLDTNQLPKDPYPPKGQKDPQPPT